MATAHRTRHPSAIPQALRSPSLPLLMTLAALAVGVAALLPLLQSSGATTTNGNVQRLEQIHADWQARVNELEVEVATLGGLERIEKEAISRFKMVAPTETVYITVPVPAPQPQRLPSRFLPAQEEPGPAKKSWWDRLFGWLP